MVELKVGDLVSIKESWYPGRVGKGARGTVANVWQYGRNMAFNVNWDDAEMNKMYAPDRNRTMFRLGRWGEASCDFETFFQLESGPW